jgi:dipeptidyl aminopeptidase/acylaminoacyl peptidase
MNERHRYFVDNSSRVDGAPYSTLYDVAGRKVSDLEKTDLSRLMASGYKFPTQFKVKAADGITDLWGVYYLPFEVDSTKLYPIVEYVYPGPQTEGVNQNFAAPSYRLEQLAQLGFVVVTVGNRGGDPRRSKWYHTYGYGNLRDYGLADKKAAAIQIADRLPFADITRVGITGHSGGGFMSTAAILQYPEFFKVAVSCAGNHDNSIYNRWWSETHHGVKEEINEKGGISDTTFVYSIANNQQLARNLKGRLLLLHGDIDNNVHPANTLLVAEALIKAGKRFDMMILPGQMHGFGDMTDYFFWMMADYFSEHLIGDAEDSVDIPQLKE